MNWVAGDADGRFADRRAGRSATRRALGGPAAIWALHAGGKRGGQLSDRSSTAVLPADRSSTAVLPADEDADGMRAAVLTGGRLVVRDMRQPVPGPGQLLLRVRLAGVCATDLAAPAAGIPDGTVLGHELVGDVVDVGPGVAAGGLLGIGRRVVALPVQSCGACVACLGGDPVHCPMARIVGTGPGATGAFAELTVVSRHAALPVPEAVPDEVAVLVEPLAAALRAVRRAGVGTADRVLVLGAGAIGLGAAAWARAVGARDVVVSDPLPMRRSLALGCGASAAIDPSPGGTAVAYRALGRKRPTVVVDCSGAEEALCGGIDLLGRGGRLVVAHLHTEPVRLGLRSAHFKELTVTFSAWYEVDDFARTLEALSSGSLPVAGVVTHVIPLDELPDAFVSLRRPTSQGKVAVDPRR